MVFYHGGMPTVPQAGGLKIKIKYMATASKLIMFSSLVSVPAGLSGM
jgi:hypothetical protein